MVVVCACYGSKLREQVSRKYTSHQPRGYRNRHKNYLSFIISLCIYMRSWPISFRSDRSWMILEIFKARFVVLLVAESVRSRTAFSFPFKTSPAVLYSSLHPWYLDFPKGGLFIECNGLNNYYLKAFKLLYEPPAIQKSVRAIRDWGGRHTSKPNFKSICILLVLRRAFFAGKHKVNA